MRNHSRLAVVLFCGVVGCGANKNVFTANAFHQGRYEYDVAYQDVAAQRLLPEDWRIDNYYSRANDPTLRPKTFGKYETEVEFDVDGDGHCEAKETLSTFDLRFENRHSAGVIWLRSVPIDETDRDKELRVLMRNAVDSVAGAEYVYWRVGDRVFGVGEHLVAQQLDVLSATVAGREAYVSTIELASVDQLKLNERRRLRNVRLVMIRSGFSHELSGYGVEKKFPVIIVAGLSDLPEYFERDLPAFQQFIGQITIGGIKGYQDSSQPKIDTANSPKSLDIASTNSNPHSVGDLAPTTKANELTPN